jgi:hypothetical protein
MPDEETKEGKREEKPTSRWITEGLIITASPIVGYMLSFVYEMGFAGVFKIPPQLITISLTTFFVATGSLFMIALLLFQLSSLGFVVFSDLSTSDSPVYRRFVRLSPGFLFSVVLLLLTAGTHSSAWIGVVGVWAIFIFLEFVFPCITQRDKVTYLEKLKAQDRLDRRRGDLLDYIAQRIGRPFITIMIFLGLITYLYYFAGYTTALKQSEFLVTDTSPERVVLRIYGDKMICAPFDRITRTVEKNFVILKMSEDPNVALHLEKIGPLSPEKTPSTQIYSPTPTSTPTSTPVPTSTSILTPTAAMIPSPQSP